MSNDAGDNGDTAPHVSPHVSPDTAPAASPASPRSPLNRERLRSAVKPWRVAVVAETGSTNADLLEAAGRGEPAGAVLAAEFQTGGRGRLDRSWTSPAGAGITVSVLLRPLVSRARWGWLPLMAGVALAQTVGTGAVLKWPNDLLIGPEAAKVGGILVQSVADAVVIGVGLNVDTELQELPTPAAGAVAATSLRLVHGAGTDRTELLLGLLANLGRCYEQWQAANGDAERCGLAGTYRQSCATLGQRVRVELTGSVLHGIARAIDADGQLLIGGDAGDVAVAAGDVTHLRTM